MAIKNPWSMNFISANFFTRPIHEKYASRKLGAIWHIRPVIRNVVIASQLRWVWFSAHTYLAEVQKNACLWQLLLGQRLAGKIEYSEMPLNSASVCANASTCSTVIGSRASCTNDGCLGTVVHKQASDCNPTCLRYRGCQATYFRY